MHNFIFFLLFAFTVIFILDICHSYLQNSQLSWTWISGSNSRNENGTYGTQGIVISSNVPGARIGSVSWIDSNNTLFLFGGFGFADVQGKNQFIFIND